jgi:hypothetical protein
MPIKRKTEPIEARTLLASSLARRMHHAKHVSALRGKVRVSGPIPVFALGFKSSRRSYPLRNVRLAGWTYLLMGNEAAGLAHLRGTRGRLSFAGLTAGPAAQDLIEAATLADEKLNSVNRSFEARVLEIPSLRIQAFWLYSSHRRSQFVALESGSVKTRRLESLDEFEERIAAAHRLVESRQALTLS